MPPPRSLLAPPMLRMAAAAACVAACVAACGPSSSTGDLLFPALQLPAQGPTATSRCAAAAGRDEAPDWLAAAVVAAACTEAVRGAVSGPADRQDLLTAAALCDDEDAVALQLAAGANVDGRDSCGGTALLATATAGSQRGAAALLRAGANPNRGSTRESGSRAPLLAALAAGHRTIASTLLDAGADANASTPGRRTALMLAVLDGDPALVDALLKKHVGVCARDENGLTALAIAHARGEPHVLQALRSPTRKCPDRPADPGPSAKKAKKASRRSRR